MRTCMAKAQAHNERRRAKFARRVSPPSASVPEPEGCGRSHGWDEPSPSSGGRCGSADSAVPPLHCASESSLRSSGVDAQLPLPASAASGSHWPLPEEPPLGTVFFPASASASAGAVDSYLDDGMGDGPLDGGGLWLSLLGDTFESDVLDLKVPHGVGPYDLPANLQEALQTLFPPPPAGLEAWCEPSTMRARWQSLEGSIMHAAPAALLWRLPCRSLSRAAKLL